LTPKLDLLTLIALSAKDTAKFLMMILWAVSVVLARRGWKKSRAILSAIFATALDVSQLIGAMKMTYDLNIPSDHFDTIDKAVTQRIEIIKLHDPAKASAVRASWVKMKADFLRSVIEEQSK